jgi:archaellin
MSVTTGTFPGVRIADMPNLGVITDNSWFVGEHAGSGLFSAPAFRDYITGSIFSWGPTNTSTPFHGLIVANDTVWAPPGNLSNNNYYMFISIPTVSLSGGGTVAQKWATSNNIFEIYANTSPGMAGSHTIGGSVYIIMPAGLGDGGGGAFVSGLPTNPAYQEVGGWQSTVTGLSPGHYVENIASYVNDNTGGAGVDLKMVGFFSVINKAAASGTYPSYGYQALSDGPQQTTNAPTSAYRVDGGWLTSMDLSGNSYPLNTAIKFRPDMSISNDATNMYFNVSGTQSLVVAGTGVEVMGGAIFNGSITATELRASPSYANDAAAAAGGVGVGNLYRNGSVVQIREA